MKENNYLFNHFIKRNGNMKENNYFIKITKIENNYLINYEYIKKQY